MSVKGKKFTDDGWAFWVDGDDTSTIYFQDWMNPKGKSFIDVSVKIIGIKDTKKLSLYVPFKVGPDEVEDISLRFEDEKIARATFASGCLIDFMKNEYTTEMAYNGKTIDIIHLSKLSPVFKDVSSGTIIVIDYDSIKDYIDNAEGYFSFRLPHKSLDQVFGTYKSAGSFLIRLRDLITTPIQSEKYGYSIRVNETRNLPSEINRLGAFHRQKLRKAVVTVSVSEEYEINDANCFQIRRLEEGLYRNFVPGEFSCDEVIMYQWKDSIKEEGFRGKFNFYLNIKRESISVASMIFYMILLTITGGLGNFFADFVYWLHSLF